jgi:opacity protein-like surface antigen
VLVALALLLALASPARAAPLFVRAGAGWEGTGGTTVTDLDCARTSPPALFGCGSGNDGLTIGARGDFGAGERWELGVGAELRAGWRLELLASRRPALDLTAEANFRGVSSPQPSRSRGRSSSAWLVVSRDVLAPARRLVPYVTAGAGIARNESEAVVYSFPTLAPGAVTIVRGGEHDDLAWMVGAGASLRLGANLHLDLDLRYTDLGEMRTDQGSATIVRSRGTVVLDVAGTRADLTTAGAGVSLRYRLPIGRRVAP